MDNKKLNDISVGALHGVGKVKKDAYARVGVESVQDLLEYFPRSYENRGDICLLCQARQDIKSAVILTVATNPRVHLIRRGMSLLKFRAFDDSGSCEIIYFNQDYLRDKFPIGATFRFWGKVDMENGKYSMSSPIAEPYIDSHPLPPYTPIYRLTDGLSQKQISQNMSLALEMAKVSLCDPMPKEILARHSLIPLYDALCSVHNPTDQITLGEAKRRLVFDELFTFALGMSMSAKSIVRQNNAPQMKDTNISPLLSMLPYTLTGAQTRAIRDIFKDMQSSIPMARILIGDVGSGKTICAASAMYIAVKNGYQACLMAPTEILATQHYNDLSPLFEKLGIKCALLTGSLTPSKKAKLHSLISTPNDRERIDIVIGTQALISDKVEFYKPALNIADEQHRFGVNQRAALLQKAKHTHTLVMSATPIPRSLALVMYGDLDVSKIDEMPRGRQRVDTFLVDESYRERLDGFIKKTVAEGSQVYIVCPAVEESELPDDELDLFEIFEGDKKPPLKAAVQYAEDLSKRLPDLNIAFVHGKLKANQKDEIMSRFAMGEIQVLVSTTVIEVGVNVPNATLMIVENSERFGLSQLHQLRGRVGRGNKKSYCILVSGTESKNQLSEKSRARLDTMCRCYNGFDIAEEDLKQRGPGDFLCMNTHASIRQSGDIYFKLADTCEDATLMENAFSEARALISRDPELDMYPALCDKVQNMFTIKSDIIN